MKRNVVIQTDQSGAQSIRGGTIGELVRQLIGSSEDEMGVDGNKYMQTFLLTYHSFMTSLQFLQRLEEAVRFDFAPCSCPRGLLLTFLMLSTSSKRQSLRVIQLSNNE
jgi:hypothetical protein